MPAAVDTVNVTSQVSTSGTDITFLGLCSGADNFLIVLEFNRQSVAGTAAPLSSTYNGVAMTMLGSVNDTSFSECSLWYLPAPVVGVLATVEFKYATNRACVSLGFIPMSGVLTSAPFGTLVTAFSVANNNPAASASGGTGVNGDLYLGLGGNNDTAQTDGGSQTRLYYNSSINGLSSATGDSLPAGATAAFSWTGTGTSSQTTWVALAVAVKGAPPSAFAQGLQYFYTLEPVTVSTTGTSNFTGLAAALAYQFFIAPAQFLSAGAFSANAANIAYSYTIEVAAASPSQLFIGAGSAFSVDVTDNRNGSVNLAWSMARDPAGNPADSYNVYLNGVLNQNVVGLLATVTGLPVTTYSASTVAPNTGNSLRPQNMPPTGFVTPSGPPNHVIHVTAVRLGVEFERTTAKAFTIQPDSIALTTPMKRIYPFPTSTLD
jgi:hypothetical protein